MSIPSNVAAERAVIGAILIDNGNFDKVCAFLTPDHFYIDEHAFLFGCAKDLINRGHAFDHITIKPFLSDGSAIDNKFLAEILDQTRSVVNVREYGQIVLDAAVRRELDGLSRDAQISAQNPTTGHSTVERLEDLQGELIRMADVLMSATEARTDGIDRMLGKIERAFKAGGNVDGIKTGFDGLDRLIGCCGASDLIILAGRPSMGKTSLATSMALNMATAGKRAAFFSFEMSDEQINQRMLSQMSGIPLSRLINGGFESVEDFQDMARHAARLRSLPLVVSDQSARSIGAIRSKCRSVADKGPLDAVFVDHLRFVRPDDQRAPRSHQLGQITYGLKELAKEFECPVIGLCQLNRGLEGRESKRPSLSDLRDSGEIEENADACAFVYRAEYYVEREKPSQEDGIDALMEWQERIEKVRGGAQIIVAKNRHGACGVADLRFHGTTTQFSGCAL